MNYESEVEDVLISNLKKKYGILADIYLKLYLKIRYLLLYPENRKYIGVRLNLLAMKDYMQFLLKELYIVNDTYKDVTMNYSYEDNSLISICENLDFDLYKMDISTCFRFKGSVSEFILDTIKDIEHKNLKFKKEQDVFLLENLKSLNQLFCIDAIHTVSKIEGFHQKDLDNQITTELALQRQVDALHFETKEVSTITEESLQRYLIRNLELIEEGLTFISKEFIIEDGRIDILAKDKDDNIVIIELKVKDDERLPWQCLYYPMAIQKAYPNKKIRMIVLAPSYKDSLFLVLINLKVELCIFDVTSTNHKIQNLVIHKY